MSLIVVVALAMSSAPGGDAMPAAVILPPANAGTGTPTASLAAAQAWLGLVDAGRWQDSWQTAGTPFRSQLTAVQWQTTIEPLRRQLGGVAGRTRQNATRSGSLPGLPAGGYEVLQFLTRFAARPDAVETVALARAGAGWRVIGYLVR